MKSRKTFWDKIKNNDTGNVDMNGEWRNQWAELDHVNSELVPDPTVMLPGYDLPRKAWSALNRIRSNHGRCNAMIHKWDPGKSPACDCGYNSQTIHHIVKDCPNRKFNGEFSDFFYYCSAPLNWINNLDVDL